MSLAQSRHALEVLSQEIDENCVVYTSHGQRLSISERLKVECEQ